MKRHAQIFGLLALGLWGAIAGCEELDPECAWLVLDFSDCPTAVINCPDSPYYGPVPGEPGTHGYNLVAAFGACTNYGSSPGPNGVAIQATTASGCISEAQLVFTLCGE